MALEVNLRILVVDDHEVVRKSICTLISTQADWAVCGEARDGAQAVEMAEALRPDLILMDVAMPRMDGVQATAILHRELPECEIILVSQNDPEIVNRQAREAGAVGFVVKSDLAQQLISIINQLATPRTPGGRLAVRAKGTRR